MTGTVTRHWRHFNNVSRSKSFMQWFRVERPMIDALGRVELDGTWCYEHCSGEFTHSPGGSYFWFEKEEDAMMFKMANC